MKKYIPILKRTQLFAGVGDDEMEAMLACLEVTPIVEVNTGAIARGYRTAPYPAPFLLSEWRATGGRVILTADAHHVGGIQFAYADAAAHARAAGYDSALILTRNGWAEVPL